MSVVRIIHDHFCCIVDLPLRRTFGQRLAPRTLIVLLGTGTVAARPSSPKADGGASPLNLARLSRVAIARFRDEPS